MSTDRLVLVSLGGLPRWSRDAWSAAGVSHFISHPGPAPSGRRFGRMLLGLGVDSFVIAFRARLKYPRARYICGSPWIAVAMRLLFVRHFWVLGVYSKPGSRSWRILRWAIGRNPVVTMLASEAELWCSEGGNAVSIRYGNTFGYPTRKSGKTECVSVFIGGMSDRDPDAMARVIDAARQSGRQVSFVIADGSGPRNQIIGGCQVVWLPFISSAEFGARISECDVVFLPLLDNARSAGHMVAIGALEAGVRVVCTETSGMQGYVDGKYISTVASNSGFDTFAKLLAVAEENMYVPASEVQQYWRDNFSLENFARRVIELWFREAAYQGDKAN